MANAGAQAAQTPDGWSELRSDPDIQFEPVVIPPRPPREPGMFEKIFDAIAQFLGEILSPVGQALGVSWPVLQWILLGGLALFILIFLLRMIGPLAHRASMGRGVKDESDWRPDRDESLALLEDADRLAADGHFAEATRLLLKRSVGQIAAARPDWVEPSSTAREISALPELSEAARAAFRTIAERVERSLFALRALNRGDWEAAREAYASFALARIERDQRMGSAQ